MEEPVAGSAEEPESAPVAVPPSLAPAAAVVELLAAVVLPTDDEDSFVDGVVAGSQPVAEAALDELSDGELAPVMLAESDGLLGGGEALVAAQPAAVDVPAFVVLVVVAALDSAESAWCLGAACFARSVDPDRESGVPLRCPTAVAVPASDAASAAVTGAASTSV